VAKRLAYNVMWPFVHMAFNDTSKSPQQQPNQTLACLWKAEALGLQTTLSCSGFAQLLSSTPVPAHK
jgi:hypothetical protein